MICQHRSCQRNGSSEVLAAFRQADKPKGVMIAESDCMGQCGSGPTVRVMPDDVWYCRVTAADVPRIIEQHLQNGKPVQDLLHPRFHSQLDAYSFNSPS